MTEHSTSEPRTALDKSFAALRGLGVRRRTDDKWIAGVCSGLADRLGIDPVIVRIAVLVLSLFWGFGVTVYLVAWVLLPTDRDEIVAERAVRDGDGGSVLLLVITAFALFGAVTWGSHGSGATQFLMVPFIVFVVWLAHRSRNGPDADQRVSAHMSGTPYTAAPAPTTAGSSPTTYGPSPTTYGPSPATYGPSPATSTPVPRRPRRRSGGALMALLAIGLALVTYGSLIWLGDEFAWTGDHQTIALAGALAAMGLLLVGLGLAGWQAGFVAFLTFVLAITAWSSTVVPSGIDVFGRVGDETWAPTSVVANAGYRLGVGEGVLDLRGLPTTGLREARIPAYVGLGELRVVVPKDLTVEVVGNVGLGEISLPGESENNGQGGTDIARSVVVGEGPTEVVVDAGVGVGQLTVVKE